MPPIGDADRGHGFELPDEILAVIPIDPYEQLDVARKITSMAISSRVSELEAEASQFRHKLADRDRTIAELRDRLQMALEDNVKLVKERDSLAATSKKLGRDLMKLETFKRHLMKSLSDENISQAKMVDIGTSDQLSTNNSSWKEEGSVSCSGSNKFIEITDIGDSIQDVCSGYKSSITPYITPHLTPIATPRVSSAGGSPRGLSTAGSSPRIICGTSSQQSSAPSSPHGHKLPGRSRIDGKEFFRQARSRISYEQFGAFLANIKELNAHRQSRQETLEKAEEILGTENRDLYLSFRNLLNCNLS